MVLESGESKIKVLADWASGESSLGWQTAASWPCPHIMERERKEARSLGGFSFNGSNPTPVTPSKPDGFSIYILEGHDSAHSRHHSTCYTNESRPAHSTF